MEGQRRTLTGQSVCRWRRSTVGVGSAAVYVVYPAQKTLLRRMLLWSPPTCEDANCSSCHPARGDLLPLQWGVIGTHLNRQVCSVPQKGGTDSARPRPTLPALPSRRSRRSRRHGHSVEGREQHRRARFWQTKRSWSDLFLWIVDPAGVRMLRYQLHRRAGELQAQRLRRPAPASQPVPPEDGTTPDRLHIDRPTVRSREIIGG